MFYLSKFMSTLATGFRRKELASLTLRVTKEMTMESLSTMFSDL